MGRNSNSLIYLFRTKYGMKLFDLFDTLKESGANTVRESRQTLDVPVMFGIRSEPQITILLDPNLEEFRLMQRVGTELNEKFIKTEAMDFLLNPTPEEILGWTQRFNDIRGICVGEHVYVWKGTSATHQSGAEYLHDTSMIEDQTDWTFVFLRDPGRIGIDAHWAEQAEPMGSVFYAGERGAKSVPNPRLITLLGRLKGMEIVRESTPEIDSFKTWMGQSRVVNSEGKPLVVYHGSNSPWVSEFDLDREGSGVVRSISMGVIWFSSSKAGASWFSDKKAKRSADPEQTLVYGDAPNFYAAVCDSRGEIIFSAGPRGDRSLAEEYGRREAQRYNTKIRSNSFITACHLRIENPLVLDGIIPRRSEVDQARAGGHDGIIAHNVTDGVIHGSVYVIFDPRQAKSVDSTGFTDHPSLRESELTTKQAADFLNVSRPFLVALLEHQKLPFRLVGTHRRVRFEDVLRYKENIDSERRKVLDQIAAEAQDIKLGY